MAIEDDGLEMTEKIRGEIQRKCTEMMLSYRQLAGILGVRLYTLQCWINGSTRHCSRRHARKLSAFLYGELDEECLKVREGYPLPDYTVDNWNRMPGLARHCLEQMHERYSEYSGNPEAQRKILETIEKLTRETIRKCLEGEEF